MRLIGNAGEALSALQKSFFPSSLAEAIVTGNGDLLGAPAIPAWHGVGPGDWRGVASDRFT
jgi:hypothetical protein